MTKEKLRNEKTILEKLQALFELVEVMKKDKDGHNYKYVEEETLLSKLTVGMAEQNIQLYPSIVPNTLKVITVDYKKLNKKLGLEEPVHENVVSADMLFTWVNLDNPSDKLEVPWIAIGQQLDASQAWGSALTYCTRYFYLKFFHVATTNDDPDNWRSKQAAVEDERNQEVLSVVLADVNKVASEFNGTLAVADKEKFVEFIKLNNKGVANYMKIKDVDEAKILLDKIKAYTKGVQEVVE